MNKLDQAEHVVRKLINERPNDSLYHCLLGDITMNADDYKRAIDVSISRYYGTLSVAVIKW
jgi:predicted Zn-dependent protease